VTIYNEEYFGVGNNDPGPGPNGWAELETSMPVMLDYSQARVIFEIDLLAAPQVGEELLILTRCEITEPYNTNVSIVDGLYLNDHPADAGGIVHASYKGIELIEDLGENTNLAIHHGVRHASTLWHCNGSEGVTPDHHWLQYTCTGESTAAQAGWTMPVMQDYGQLRCAFRRPFDIDAWLTTKLQGYGLIP
jgi:hypothetical protein